MLDLMLRYISGVFNNEAAFAIHRHTKIDSGWRMLDFFNFLVKQKRGDLCAYRPLALFKRKTT